DANRIAETVARVIGTVPRPVALHEPEIRNGDIAAVADCVRGGWVSPVAPIARRFEAELGRISNSEHVIVCSSGTAALHLALLAIGVGPGDEVLVPALSFAATANAVVYCGAQPHFCDVEPQALGLDPAALARHLAACGQAGPNGLVNRNTGRRIAAVLPMHAFGHPVALDEIAAICAQYDLPLVEDAAEALGSTYHGRPVGSIGRIGIFSFNGNKIVTTGGGGAVVTNDAALGEKARHLGTTARRRDTGRIEHDAVGFNYGMPGLNAALGLAQVERLPELIQRKRDLAGRYRAAFAGMAGTSLVEELPDTRSIYWLNTLMLDNAAAADAALAALHERQIMARPIWTPLHLLPMFRDSPRMPDMQAERLAACGINLPSSAHL
ncbi:LegC family aminotransferase, partial [Ferrovibrio sp.]|uniref:LegC family aminotransferase n=1 Tax=Ferrovibrio sp. TaxID=1917215 RepID=UPI00262C708B